MKDDMILSLVAIFISSCVLLVTVLQSFYEKRTYQNKVYETFFKMWFLLDGIFIEHPNMHKYFYQEEFKSKVPNSQDHLEEYELGICIAEQIREIFQYTEPLIVQLPRKYDSFIVSYKDYFERVSKSQLYVTADKNNRMKYEEYQKVGDIVDKELRKRGLT